MKGVSLTPGLFISVGELEMNSGASESYGTLSDTDATVAETLSGINRFLPTGELSPVGFSFWRFLW